MADLDLDDRARSILDLEKRAPWPAGAREAQVWARWRLTPTAYFQILNRLIDTEAALAYDPHTVNRLRRTRARFQRTRRSKGTTG